MELKRDYDALNRMIAPYFTTYNYNVGRLRTLQSRSQTIPQSLLEDLENSWLDLEMAISYQKAVANIVKE